MFRYLFAEGLKAELSHEGLTAVEPLPTVKRMAPLAGAELWRRAQEHLTSAITLQNETGRVEIAAVCDVFNRYRKQSAKKEKATAKHRGFPVVASPAYAAALSCFGGSAISLFTLN